MPVNDSSPPILAWGIITAEVVLLTLLFPDPERSKTHHLKEGMVSPNRIVAHADFYVWKHREEYDTERAAARMRAPSVLVYRPDIGSEQLASFDSLWARLIALLPAERIDSVKIAEMSTLGPIFNSDTMLFLLEVADNETKRGNRLTLSSLYTTCRSFLVDAYSVGYVGERSPRAGELKENLIIVKDGVEYEAPLSTIRDITHTKEEILTTLKQRFVHDNRAVNLCYRMVSGFLKPNLLVDPHATEERRRKAEEAVSPYRGFYVKDEKIIDANEKVTASHVEALNSMEQDRAKRSLENPLRRIFLMSGRFILCASLVLLFVIYLKIFRPEYDRIRYLLLFTLLTILPCVVASALAEHPSVSPFFVPLALSAMLTTLLADAEVGLVLTFTCAFLVGSMLNNHFQVAIVSGLCGALSVYAVRHVKHRQQFYAAMILLPCAYLLTIVATEAFRFVSFDRLLDDLLPGILTGVLSPILVIGLLPIFESVFKITTDMTLLEMTDLNRPLLRELVVRAPGTFAHSITMANLSEAAAEAIGANPLIARVGCYYHDIGKMVRPQYFIENQVGIKNPHDKLTPTMSAMIIMSHVREGLQIAREHRLPKVIGDLIPQHQGTTRVEYFYERAVEREGRESVREEAFCYPGPKPQTKEAGVMMLADGVEAASHTLKERTPDRIKGLINEIIKKRFTEGELDECDLTMKDLHKIAESFLRVLLGTMHGRVEYPWQKEMHDHPSETTVPDLPNVSDPHR
jgi:putative nucleotidyltransferase with HDIG domain